MLEKVYDINPKQLFLIDAIGALVSAIFLGVILVALHDYIGLSKETLYILSVPACFFAFYSFSCYFFLTKNWSKFLIFIALANLIYALVTISLMFSHFQEMRFLGFVYFIGELIILFLIIRIEFKVISKNINK